MTPQEIHNKDAGLLIRAIVKPTLDAGGEFTDVLVLLESVVTGVLLFGIKTGGDECAINLLFEGVQKRLAELRQFDPKYMI